MVSDANEADARALPNGLVALNAPPGEAWRSSAGATPAGGARDPLRRVPRCDTRALVRNAGRRGTRPRRRCRRSSLACAPSSCGRYDADATVRFRWTARARRRAAPPTPPPSPRQVGRAFPVEVRHLGASDIGDAAATAARDTAVVAAAAAAAGCCCALTRTEPGRNRAHRTHEAPAACVECVACERARWRGVARRAAAAAAAVRLARLI